MNIYIIYHFKDSKTLFIVFIVKIRLTVKNIDIFFVNFLFYENFKIAFLPFFGFLFVNFGFLFVNFGFLFVKILKEKTKIYK